MKFRFLGANRQVTGSRHYLEVGGARLLVDCGMYQERGFSDRNWEPSPVPPDKIDAVLLTHAHVDHCGLVPKLVREGFRGPLIATAATAELVELILRDSARIQQEDAEYKKRRHRKEGRRGKHPVVPLFTERDVDRAVALLKPVPYQRETKINDQVWATFHDAGHILGSAVVEVAVSENDRIRRLLFTGDLGQWGKPIIRDPTTFDEADAVVMESTYGDRDHRLDGGVEDQLADVINRTVARGGNVVIPTFAVERAQELLYYLGQLIRQRRIDPIDVFLSSPMAIDVTKIFRRHRECFDDEAWEIIGEGNAPLRFPGLKLAPTVGESKAIHKRQQPVIVMATSGMCTAGRIKHHLRHNIARAESTILFVGFQAPGTLGRKILDGNSEVRIHGRSLPVRAAIERIEGFSGHADRAALLRWLRAFRKGPSQLFLVHGEEQGSLALADQIRDELGWNVSVPEYLDTVKL